MNMVTFLDGNKKGNGQKKIDNHSMLNHPESGGQGRIHNQPSYQEKSIRHLIQGEGSYTILQSWEEKTDEVPKESTKGEKIQGGPSKPG
jgi:hypothetical protein